MKFVNVIIALFTLTAYFHSSAFAADEVETIEVRIKDHVFDKSEVKVKAGQKFKFVVYNDDAQVEEFESKKLGVEKMVKGKSSLTLKLGPLKPGKYDFVGEFHEQSAKGTLIVE